MKTLVWFRNDLRLDNNRLIEALEKFKDGIVIDETMPQASIDSFIKYSNHKQEYRTESIHKFVNKLKNKGFNINVLKGNPLNILPLYCHANKIDKIITSRIFDQEEEKQKIQLEKILAKDNIYIDYVYNNSFIPIDELPFPIKRTPEKFKEFMKEIKDLEKRYCKIKGTEEDKDFVNQLLEHIEENNMYELKKYVYSPNNNFFQFLPDLTLGRISSPELLSWLENRYKSNPIRTKMLKLFKQQLFMYEHIKLKYMADTSLNFAPPPINREPEVKAFQKWITGDTKNPMMNAIMKKMASSAKISLTSKKIAIDYYNHILELPPFWGYWYFKKQLMEYSNELNAYLWKQSTENKIDKRQIQVSLSELSLKLDPKNKFINYWTSI
jgi:deoxyribodipyrimidine photo-lyase